MPIYCSFIDNLSTFLYVCVCLTLYLIHFYLFDIIGSNDLTIWSYCYLSHKHTATYQFLASLFFLHWYTLLHNQQESRNKRVCGWYWYMRNVKKEKNVDRKIGKPGDDINEYWFMFTFWQFNTFYYYYQECSVFLKRI